MKYRTERLGKLIMEQLNLLIVRNLDFSGALPTITDVDVTEELDHAKVKVSVWPSERKDEVMKILHDAQGNLQYLLMKKIQIRALPRIEFVYDRGAENAADVEKAILGK